MELSRNRIWGNYVGGNVRSGYKELKRPWAARAKASYYEHANLKMLFPFFDKWEEHNKKKLKYEERKNRIFMRGIKVGVRQGGGQSNMAMFETNKAAAAGAEAEKKV